MLKKQSLVPNATISVTNFHSWKITALLANTHRTGMSHKMLLKVVSKNSFNPLGNSIRLFYIENGKSKGHIKNLSELTAHIQREDIRTWTFLILNLYASSLLSGEEEEQRRSVSAWSVFVDINKYLFTVDGTHTLAPTYIILF